MNIPTRITPDADKISSAVPVLKKGSRKRGAAIFAGITGLFPIMAITVTFFAEEEMDAESIIAVIIAGAILGLIGGFFISRFYSKNSELSSAMLKAVHINVEDSYISGVGLQSLAPNMSLTTMNAEAFYGKLFKLSEFNLGYRQITNVEVFDLTLENIDYGKCCTIHAANMPYTFLCLNSDEVYELQSLVREKIN